MPNVKITRAVDAAGAVTYSEVTQTFVEQVIDSALLPLSALSENNEFISKQQAGVAMLGGVAGGVFLGDKYGDRIPVLGGRR